MTSPRPPGRPIRESRRPRGGVRQTLDNVLNREIQRSGAIIVGVIIAVAAVVDLSHPVQIWFEQQARLAELDNEVAAARAALAEAQADVDRWSDRAYIEAQARERLMFVYPGDISYLVVNDVDAKPTKSNEVLGTVQRTSIDWVEAFVQSYAFAAKPETESE
ncbi:MAG: septum formation initiator family protein [Microbacteriaceae bacterium]|nr:septum formation initiator family protein [Microbacteriaceae bacterium]